MPDELTRALVEPARAITAVGERLLACGVEDDLRPEALPLRAWLLAVAATLADLAEEPVRPEFDEDARAALAEEYRDPLDLRRDGLQHLLDDVL